MEEHQQEQHQPSSSLFTQYFTLSDNKQTRKRRQTIEGQNAVYKRKKKHEAPIAPAPSAGTKRQ